MVNCSDADGTHTSARTRTRVNTRFCFVVLFVPCALLPVCVGFKNQGPIEIRPAQAVAAAPAQGTPRAGEEGHAQGIHSTH